MMNQHNNFWGLAKLGFPEGRQEALRGQTPSPSNLHKQVLLPDDQLMCFDILYYTAAFETFEWEKDYSPAWRFVGRHLHFKPDLVKLAEFHTRKALGIQEDSPIPPVSPILPV